ncbi:hypothetical protein ACJX0J_002082 [Zea mays]
MYGSVEGQVRLTSGFEITAYIPGIGHNLQEHSVVLRFDSELLYNLWKAVFDESRISTLQYGAKKAKKISDSQKQIHYWFYRPGRNMAFKLSSELNLGIVSFASLPWKPWFYFISSTSLGECFYNVSIELQEIVNGLINTQMNNESLMINRSILQARYYG